MSSVPAGSYATTIFEKFSIIEVKTNAPERSVFRGGSGINQLIPLECLNHCRPLMSCLCGRGIHVYLSGYRLQAHSKLEVTIFLNVLGSTQRRKEGNK